MQSDYNCGSRFIGYAITRIELIQDNPYSQDENLRFFEYKAIIHFESDNIEKGYNKRADKKECREIRKIEWAKRYIEDYFWNKEMSKHPKHLDDIKYHKSEMELYIKKH